MNWDEFSCEKNLPMDGRKRTDGKVLEKSTITCSASRFVNV